MDVRVLGPVEASVEGRPIALGGGKPRALLAMLALNAGTTLSSERLIDGLWGERPPATAFKLVQVYVSQLRKALAASGDDAEIVTRRHGYELRVGTGTVDAERFERLLAQGAPREALELWRGPPLDDVADEPFAGAEIRRLEQLRLAALELAIEQDLDKGRHRDVIAELEALVAAEPLRERLHAMLMLALYRSGRQADALEAYRHAREVLVEQLGIEPGAQLQELQQAILGHDPSIDAPGSAVDVRFGGLSAAPTSPDGLGERRLPAPPNRTIGRAHEVATVGGLLRTGSVRLLTLTGPGGVGKTRLALEIAHAVEGDFADGAYFVSLGAVQQAEDVPAAIVKALGIILLSGESADQAVERFLAGKHLLLVMDNCEHLLGAAPFIGGLPSACPAVAVLATSREALSVHAEQRYPVSPLALPQLGTRQDTEVLAGVDAVALFCERARAHDPGFQLGDGNATDVAEICNRVDGLPLAIELAAARCALLSPGEIAKRLHATLGALGAGTRDAPARQQTLRATIDWSHGLLSEREKECFARFAVFASGATTEAAEVITGADLDTLDSLVAKSMLTRRHYAHAPTRLLMLETVRAYALERLATAGGDVVRERHYRYYLALAQRHGTDRALSGPGRREHLARLDGDIINLHAALGWAVSQDSAEPALAMCSALGWYWLVRDRYSDAVRWIDQAMSLPGADADPALRVRALCIKSRSLWPLGRGAEQHAVVTEAEAIARALAEPVLLSQVLQTRAYVEADAGRGDVAEALADEALRWAEAAGDGWETAIASHQKAMTATTIAELRERVERAAKLLDEAGNLDRLGDLLASASYVALCIGSDRDATEFVQRAIPIARELDNPYLWMGLRSSFALAALLTGDTEAAREAFREALGLCRELVVLPFASEGLGGLAAVAVVRSDLDRAARLVGAAAAHRYGSAEDPVDERLQASFFQPARARHGADAWDAAIHAGASLSFHDAIAYALEEPSRHLEPYVERATTSTVI